MNTQHPTDELIRAAIARRAEASAEGDLRERILAATAATRQRRGWGIHLDGGRLFAPTGLVLRLTIALILLATVALIAMLVGRPADRTPPARLGALAYLSEGDLYVAGPAGESARRIWDLPAMGGAGGWALAWLDAETVLLNTGASFLVVSQLPEGAYLVDVTSGTHRLLVPGWYVALSPDRRLLATSTFDEGATPQDGTRLIEIASGAIVGEIPGTIGGFAWSPDGRAIAGETGDTVYRADVATGERTVLVTGLCCGMSSHAPTWSPDGTRIAYVDYHVPPERSSASPAPRDCSFRCGTIWTVNVTGGVPTRITPEPGSEVSPAFSPDGHWIAYMEEDDSDLNSWNELVIVAADGTGRRVLTPSPEIPPVFQGDAYVGDRFAWDPDSGGLWYLWLGSLWHVALDGTATRIEGPPMSEFARQVVP